MSAVLESPQTRWILFQAGQPLVKSTGAPRVRTLAQLPTSDIKSLLGPTPVFGQGKEPGEGVQHLKDGGDPVSTLEAARLHGPTIVFLGLHELDNNQGQSALPSSEFSAKVDPKLAASNISGSPYFALDVTSSEKQTIEGLLDTSKKNGVTLEFAEPRSATSDFSAFEAGVFAEARSMIDWNDRNKVREHAISDSVVHILMIFRGRPSFAPHAGHQLTPYGRDGSLPAPRRFHGPITPGRDRAPLRV